MTNPFDSNNLFSNIDLSANDFLDPSEAKAFDNIFQAPAGSNPFANAPVTPVVEENKEKDSAPVVPIKTESNKEEGTKKETKGKGKKKSELTKTIKEQKKKREEMKVDTTWNIAYAAQQYNPPEDGLTLDQVREWLELDYPELSKERCRLEVDEEKKLIVPIVSGAKKG